MSENEARQAAWSKLCRPELIGNDGTKLRRIDNFDAGWNAAAEHYKGEMLEVLERTLLRLSTMRKLNKKEYAFVAEPAMTALKVLDGEENEK